jgi:hypothetical protein
MVDDERRYDGMSGKPANSYSARGNGGKEDSKAICDWGNSRLRGESTHSVETIKAQNKATNNERTITIINAQANTRDQPPP